MKEKILFSNHGQPEKAEEKYLRDKRKYFREKSIEITLENVLGWLAGCSGPISAFWQHIPATVLFGCIHCSRTIQNYFNSYQQNKRPRVKNIFFDIFQFQVGSLRKRESELSSGLFFVSGCLLRASQDQNGTMLKKVANPFSEFGSEKKIF